jgi:hypothetical protein
MIVHGYAESVVVAILRGRNMIRKEESKRRLGREK